MAGMLYWVMSSNIFSPSNGFLYGLFNNVYTATPLHRGKNKGGMEIIVKKKKKDVSCDPCSGATGIFNFPIRDKALRTTGVPSPQSPPPHPRQLQGSPCSTRGPGQEGAGQQAPHMEMGKSLGESERCPRTPDWTEVSSQAGEKGVDPEAQGCLGAGGGGLQQGRM